MDPTAGSRRSARLATRGIAPFVSRTESTSIVCNKARRLSAVKDSKIAKRSRRPNRSSEIKTCSQYKESCHLLELPAEVLSHILSYLLKPRNNRLHLITNSYLRPGFPVSSNSACLISNELYTDDDIRYDAKHGYRSNFVTFCPPVLCVKFFHTLALDHIHRNVILHLTIGHNQAADVLLNTRNSLRNMDLALINSASTQEGAARDMRRWSSIRGRQLRVRAMLDKASSFRRIAVGIMFSRMYESSVMEQLAVLLECLAGSASPAGLTDDTESEFDIHKNYIAIDLADWARLLSFGYLVNCRRRSARAMGILTTLMKWQRSSKIGERLLVDLRGSGSVPYNLDPRDEDQIEENTESKEVRDIGANTFSVTDDGRAVLSSGPLRATARMFLEQFRSRTIVAGTCEWGVECETGELTARPVTV